MPPLTGVIETLFISTCMLACLNMFDDVSYIFHHTNVEINNFENNDIEGGVADEMHFVVFVIPLATVTVSKSTFNI